MSDLYSVFPGLVPNDNEVMAAELLTKQVLEAKFPDMDLREGTGLRDLTIRPSAYSYSLLKKALDYYFASNVLSGVNDTTDTTIVDDIMSNWFMTRQNGVQAVINARLYFATQKNITVPSSVFFSTDNTLRFFPPSTLTLPSSAFSYDAYQNEWYIDIVLVAERTGIEYNIGSGSLLYFTNFDPYFLHAEINFLSQSATDPETNLQFIERSKSAISTRNLINIPSVSSNLQTSFNTLKRNVTVGMGDPDMIRDQIRAIFDPEDARTPTGLTQTGGVVTAVLANHGFYTGQVVNVAEATPSGYNGQYTITVVDSATFTYSVIGTPGICSTFPTIQSVTSPCLIHMGGMVDIYVGDSVSSNIIQVTTDNTGMASLTGPIYAFSRSQVSGGSSPDAVPLTSSVNISGKTLNVAGSVLNVTSTGPHGLANGTAVTVSGVSQTKTLTTLSCTNLVVTAILASHGLSTGMKVTVSGVTPINYNGTYTITVVDANTFTYVLPSNPLTSGSGTMIISNPSVNGAFSIIYTGTNTFNIAMPGVWAGATNSVASLSITYSVPYTTTNPTLQTKTLQTLAGSSTIATATLNNHGYMAGRYVTISGATPSYYNGTFKITNVLGPTQFQYNAGTALLAPATGTILCKSTIPSQDFGFSENQVWNVQFGAGYANSTVSFQVQYFDHVADVQAYLDLPANRVLCGGYLARGFNLYVLDINVVVYNTMAPTTGLVQSVAQKYLASLDPGATFVLSDLVSALTTAGVNNIQTPMGVGYTYYHRDLITPVTGVVVDYLDPLDKTNIFILGNVATSSVSV